MIIYKIWYAFIHYKNKRIHLGCYKKEIDAAAVYNINAKEIFGDIAILNQL